MRSKHRKGRPRSPIMRRLMPTAKTTVLPAYKPSHTRITRSSGRRPLPPSPPAIGNAAVADGDRWFRWSCQTDRDRGEHGAIPERDPPNRAAQHRQRAYARSENGSLEAAGAPVAMIKSRHMRLYQQRLPVSNRASSSPLPDGGESGACALWEVRGRSVVWPMRWRSVTCRYSRQLGGSRGFLFRRSW